MSMDPMTALYNFNIKLLNDELGCFEGKMGFGEPFIMLPRDESLRILSQKKTNPPYRSSYKSYLHVSRT